MGDSIVIRLRSRDGCERVQVSSKAKIVELKQAIEKQLGLSQDQIVLSTSHELLQQGKEGVSSSNMQQEQMSIEQVGIQHGSMVFMWYPDSRAIDSGVNRTKFEQRKFGERMTVEQMVARQVYIERQESGSVSKASLDRKCADVFQSYVREQLGFSVKRGGILYGKVDDGTVYVDVIYEPPQHCTSTQLVLERHTSQEQLADQIAELLGLQKVGWVFSQCPGANQSATNGNADGNQGNESQGNGQASEEGVESWILSNDEVISMASIQSEFGEHAITCLVSIDTSDGSDGHVMFEAFQCSKQAVTLYNDGWMNNQPEQNTGKVKLFNPKHPELEKVAIVERKDMELVDTDWFLVPVGIADHESNLLTSFPVENRFFDAATGVDLRTHMRQHASATPSKQLGDFHLLLWLAQRLDMEADIKPIVKVVTEGEDLLPGHQLLLDELAGA